MVQTNTYKIKINTILKTFKILFIFNVQNYFAISDKQKMNIRISKHYKQKINLKHR